MTSHRPKIILGTEPTILPGEAVSASDVPCDLAAPVFSADRLSQPDVAGAQIDPVHRELIQVGYNAAMQGHAPSLVMPSII